MHLNRDLQQLQANLNISFQNEQLLRQAFTHSSYVNEHRSLQEQDNERLEFLGDAVLELAVSEFLYHQFQHLSEGELTKFRASIVCEPSLVNLANRLHFGDYILLGKGEEMTGGRSRPALLADVFEAFIGALYLDQGWSAVQAFLDQRVFSSILTEDDIRVEDFKTQLQEEVQRDGLGEIEYRIIDEKGPAHDRFFSCEVMIQHEVMGRGSGRSKKEAEQQAAAQALAKLRTIKR